MRILSEHRESKDLNTHLALLESADPRTPSRNPFIIRTYNTPLDLRIPKDLQPLTFLRNPFGIRTYRRASEVWQTQGL